LGYREEIIRKREIIEEEHNQIIAIKDKVKALLKDLKEQIKFHKITLKY